ncbi:hypothetical protein Misp06_01084 [Microbulbifer sp. NBRC 101763]|uniref:hypothetical protein n=1 Tax=Microbulbifer sp. NBRC 101763 TaxID=1113820 RepID=UPI0030B429B1
MESFEALQWIVDWLGNLREESDSFFEQALLWFAALYIETKIWVAEMAWSVASTIVDSFQIGNMVGSAFGGVNSTAMSYINYFKLVDCINVLLNAATTRFILSMVGW